MYHAFASLIFQMSLLLSYFCTCDICTPSPVEDTALSGTLSCCDNCNITAKCYSQNFLFLINVVSSNSTKSGTFRKYYWSCQIAIIRSNSHMDSCQWKIVTIRLSLGVADIIAVHMINYLTNYKNLNPMGSQNRPRPMCHFGHFGPECCSHFSKILFPHFCNVYHIHVLSHKVNLSRT